MHEPPKASSDDAMHGPPSSLLRVAQQFALEHSERRTSYIGRFSGLIEGKSVISSVVEKSKGILKIIRSLRVGRDDNLVYFERSRRMSHLAVYCVWRSGSYLSEAKKNVLYWPL